MHLSFKPDPISGYLTQTYTRKKVKWRMYKVFHSSIIYDSNRLEITQLSIKRELDV